MKNTALIFSMVSVLILSSCSSDDSNNNNDDINEDSRLLTHFIQDRYDEGEFFEKIVFSYENNKPKRFDFFNSENELTSYSEWNYSSDGYLSSLKGYLSDGTLFSETSVTYDNSNRILSKNRVSNNNTSTTDYTYNNDNTITSTTDNGSFITTKLFELNNTGIIFKETTDSNTVTVIYDDDSNALSKTSYSNTINFILNNENLRQGVFLSNSENTYGNINNNVLYGNSLDDQFSSYGNKYIISSTSSDESFTNTYIFDQEGYPSNLSRYRNGELISDIEYFYEE